MQSRAPSPGRFALLLILTAGLFGSPDALAQRGPMRAGVQRKPVRTAPRPAPPGRAAGLGKPSARRLGPLTRGELERAPARAGLEAVGVHRALDLRSAGKWTEAGGQPIWRVAVASEGAAAVRLHFTGFAVGAGQVWVYSAQDEAPRAFAGAGPNGDGDFWTAVAFGDEVVVEYRPAAGAAASGEPPFRIAEIAHLWESLPQLAASARASAQAVRSPLDFLQAPPAAGPAGLDAGPAATFTGVEAAACHVDVTCYAEWEETSRAVALIVFESGGRTYSCSGTLLNTRNQSFVPYFLTAAHCIASNADARTVQAFWSFRSAACNGPAPPAAQLESTLGAQQVLRLGDFDDQRGDLNLLLLSEAPPDGAVFSGWDPSAIGFGAYVAGIHHPQGEHQRISFGSIVQDRYYGASSAYAIVQEQVGRTESGSSGSGLFTGNSVLIGALSFGPALRRDQTVCDIQPFYSGYTRFAAIYPHVRAYLEDEIPPPDPDAISGDTRDFRLSPVRAATLFADPTLEIEVPPGALSLTIELRNVSPPRADVDLHVRKGSPPEVASGAVVDDHSSTGPYSEERIVIDASSSPPLEPGMYYVRLALYTRLTEVTGQVAVSIETNAPAEGAPAIAAVLHAADQSMSAITPGQLVSIYGANLGSETGVQPPLGTDGRIPVTANGVSVSFNGVAAPILFARADQINVQVPYEIGGAAAVQVTVTRDGRTSSPATVEAAEAAPQIFRRFDGAERAVAFHPDGTASSVEAPIRRGEIVVFYVTGQGAVEPAMATGALAQSPAMPVAEVGVTIGGRDAEVLFAGVPPGLAGVMQVNARAPADSAMGPDVILTVRVGGVESRGARLAVE